MRRVRPIRENERTQDLADRIQKIWDAYLVVDAAVHSELLADDYRRVHPDGTVQLGKPTAQEIAAAPMKDYCWRTWRHGWWGRKERSQPTTGEVWMKHAGEWKCRYYHATMQK